MPTSARLALALPLLLTPLSRAADAVDFARDVRPLLQSACVRCHGPEKQKGGLRLDSRAAALAGGDSGSPALKPGDPAGSDLVRRMTAADPAERMPPQGEPLPAEQVALLTRWVAGGADWPGEQEAAKPARREMVVTDADREHWAFRPLRPVAVPSVRRADWPRTDVDRFILAALEAKGLSPSPEADRRTLVRRLTFDLTGLPPAPEDVDAFVADQSKDAYEKLVDRLLASPRRGERWARHWLDAARYADSDGYERDADRPHAWPYRDFVIGAVNDDLPYDVFLRWQLAGDELARDDPRARAATGFLAAGPVLAGAATSLEEELRRYRADELDDIVTTTGSAMLGLTVGCARCHDHKYDALPTRDYYRTQAAFVTSKRTEVMLKGVGSQETTALTVTDASATPHTTYLLERGDAMSRKEAVPAGFLSVLTRGRSPDDYLAAVRAKAGDRPPTTLRRAALAEWLTDVEHGAGALAARVAVNRVWQHHFGEGLVRTPGDFGTRGDAPSHPELLDWLAARFVADGWSQKKLHRLILSSAAYQQSGSTSGTQNLADPDNRLLWQKRPRRLEAEALRDAILAVSGAINLTAGGPGVKPPVPAGANAAYNTINPYPKDAKDEPATRRRSVYVFGKRSLRQPLFEAFDAADASSSCPRRVNTTVAPQALALLNDDLIRARAADFAKRVLDECGADDARLVGRAYALALGREPRPAEADAAGKFLRERAAAKGGRGGRDAAVADFCQVLFGLNEFMYID